MQHLQKTGGGGVLPALELTSLRPFPFLFIHLWEPHFATRFFSHPCRNGGYTYFPDLSVQTFNVQRSSDLSLFFSYSCALFGTIKNSTHLFSGNCALFIPKHRGWGGAARPLRTSQFIQCLFGRSLRTRRSRPELLGDLVGTPWTWLFSSTFNCQLSTYRVQRISSFFSTWAKSRSLVAREALRATARAAAKPST